MTQPSDTSPDAERVLVEVYRRLPAGRKWLQLRQMYRDARALHEAGLRLREPSASPRRVRQSWLAINYGFTGLPAPDEATPEGAMDNLEDVREVIRILTTLGIPYALGGSMASSLYGIGRYTRDADLTVEPFPGKETPFAAAFGPDWYVSVPMIEEAIRRRSSFNVINTSTGFKVDLFVCKDEPFERSAMARRLSLDLPGRPGQPIILHTAEDVILFKLRWYRIGGEASNQQWTDILGVFKVQAEKLDQSYLDRWAADLGVTDLLQRARREAGL